MSEMVSIAILRPTVIDGEDVFPGDKRKVVAATARRLIALGKAEEVKRGRPRKNGKAAAADTPPADDATVEDVSTEAVTDQPPLMGEVTDNGE